MNKDIVWETIFAKFPDAVDYVMVHDRTITEQVWDHTDPKSYMAREDDETDIPVINQQTYHLTEVEPETGIYAVMSPVSRRVYIYALLDAPWFV
jgi:hypothetical protein